MAGGIRQSSHASPRMTFHVIFLARQHGNCLYHPRMRPLLSRVSLLAVCLLIVGCASRPLPKFEKPIARMQFQRVRTTAYTDTESDHVQYSNHNALGGTLQYGSI